MEYPKPAAVIPEDDDLDLDVSCRSSNVDNFEAGYPRTSNDMDFIVINDCNRSSSYGKYVPELDAAAAAASGVQLYE
jgi:hypothetical protein